MLLNFKSIIRLIIIVSIYWSGLLFGLEKPRDVIVPVSFDTQAFLPTVAKYADWMFVGSVENESGEIYNYAFQMLRADNEFHVRVLLINGQTKELIFEDDSSAILESPDNYKWAVGKSFLRFNKITNSWVFGFKNEKKEGFNFKVGMLNNPDAHANIRKLNGKVTYIIVEAGQLNGHIKFGGEKSDQFVTAKSAWFRQLEFLQEDKDILTLNSLLCRFNDGRSLYSMNLSDAYKTKNMLVELFDNNGKSLKVSQFVGIEKNLDNSWRVKISIPKLEFVFKNLSTNDNFVSGLMTGANEGFCTFSTDTIIYKNQSNVLQQNILKDSEKAPDALKG